MHSVSSAHACCHGLGRSASSVSVLCGLTIVYLRACASVACVTLTTYAAVNESKDVVRALGRGVTMLAR